MLEKFNTILFDLDGTLIDSMTQHYKAWSEVLDRHGKQISIEDFFALEGMNIYQMMAKLTSITNPEIIKLIIREKDDLFIKNFDFILYHGALELIEKLKKKNYKMGIVTASSKYRFEKTIPEEFRNKFCAVVTSDDEGPGKPDPWPYLCGVSKINSIPKNTLVFENAPLGITSAKAAKLTCVGIGSTINRDSLPDVEYYYESISDFNLLVP
jgi:HAD superfamily hydrolase (TIGR01509 family)